ncbi:hypothetical protein Daus18300_011892 [Diaporthe australafricana]|uniref:Uncharacterized protein n=1 Tax=Diaporthe australafricana TaxID=127596 RepID=A0ABR3W4T9_9PEZI
MLNRLRSEIRNFSKKYFGNELQHPSYVEIAPGWPAEVMQATTPGEDTFVDYLLSRRRCPLIIRAFIWRYLTGIVFNGALWGDNNRIRKHFSGLQRALSKFYTQQHAKPERIRRYQQWKQATTKLALELHEIPPIDPRFDTMARRHATAISKVLTPFMRTDPGGHMDSLVEIINQAIELDREISQQLPLITWAFKPRPSEATFPGSAEPTFNFSRDQGNIMKLQRGESMPTRVAEGGEAKVYLVVAPGLTQRGEDNGQATSFGEEVWIEKMHVSCVEPRMQATFGPRNGGYAIQS